MAISLFFQRAAREVRAVWSQGRERPPRGFVSEWIITILTLLFITTTVVQAYVVPTGSMETNLRVGDHLLVDRLSYGGGSRLLPYREPQHGDIVVFLFPEDVKETYVKRVIGVPGDRIHLEDKQVVRNGRHLAEPYTRHVTSWIDPYRDNFPQAPAPITTPRGLDMLANHIQNGEVVVPPGTLFVMGDNRDDSADSRYWGFVPREYVLGKPLIVYWSYDASTEDLREWTLNHAVDVALHFFSKTRWERTLLIPRSRQAQELEGAQ